MALPHTKPEVELRTAATPVQVETPGFLVPIPGCQFLQTGLIIEKGLAFDHWDRLGLVLTHFERSWQWWMGDWLRFGERSYGESYSQATVLSGYNYQTLADCAWVAGQIEFSRRRENLSFSHHREVAALPCEQREILLERAESEGWTRHQIRREAQLYKAETKAAQEGRVFDRNLEMVKEVWARYCEVQDELCTAASGAGLSLRRSLTAHREELLHEISQPKPAEGREIQGRSLVGVLERLVANFPIFSIQLADAREAVKTKAARTLAVDEAEIVRLVTAGCGSIKEIEKRAAFPISEAQINKILQELKSIRFVRRLWQPVEDKTGSGGATGCYVWTVK